MRFKSSSPRFFAMVFSVALCANAVAAAPGAASAAPVATAPKPTPDPYAALKIGKGSKSLKQTADAEIAGSSDLGNLDENIRLAEKLSQRQGIRKNAKKDAKAKKKSAQKQDLNAPIGTTATQELVPDKADQSAGILPTPGTVRSAIEPVKNPETRATFEADVAFQTYKPAGIMRLPSMNPFDLGSIPAGPMIVFDIRWFAAHFETRQPVAIGPFFSFGYSSLPVKLTSPSGTAISRTELHLIKAELGGALGWQPSLGSPWGARLELGGGQLTETQASTSSFANHSSSLLFASAGLYGERKVIEHLTVFAGYNYSAPIGSQPEEIELQRSNLLAGLTR
jgi:hypothetical protein